MKSFRIEISGICANNINTEGTASRTITFNGGIDTFIFQAVEI